MLKPQHFKDFKISYFQPPNVVLSRTGTAFGDIMAEYVLGHILAREKNIPGMYKNHNNTVWNQ